jgi:hypothetical protein
MDLAVVQRVEGATDVLTGEQLELDARDLCLAFDSPEQKRMNDKLMTVLRQQAHKKK